MGSLYYLVHLSILLYQLHIKERQRFNLYEKVLRGMLFQLELLLFSYKSMACVCV